MANDISKEMMLIWELMKINSKKAFVINFVTILFHNKLFS